MTGEQGLPPRVGPGVGVLRWALAGLLGVEAMHLVVATLRSTHPHPPLLALGALEAVACVLLIPARSRRVGALLLAGTLLFAAALHVERGEHPPAAFIVYLPAILVVG